MPGFGIDLTACWRPRVGMVSVTLELAAALLQAAPEERFTLFFSQRPLPGFGLDGQSVAALSPHRHEVFNKLAWFPFAETRAGLDALLYPYWPCPPRRSRAAPPAAVFIHDLSFRVRPAEVPWQQRLYMGALVPRALDQAAAVLVPSESARRDLLESYPRPGLAERLHLVREGPSNLGPMAARLPAGLSPGFILAVGTVEPRKNYPRLLDAYAALRSRRPDLPPLVVAGKIGWAYGDAARRLRSEAGVIHLGHVTDGVLLALYRSAAILAFVSLYEGFGLPLLEAMGEGLPALIGSGGALPELAAGAALEVDPEDPEAIGEGLERLLGDSALRSVLAAAGRRRAADFSWATAAGQTLRILRDLR